MAVTTTNLGVITAYGDAVAAGYTGTKAEWQALMASYATVGQQAVDAKNDAVVAKNTAVSKATEATTAATTATTKASEASASAQSIAQSAAQIQENTDDIEQLKSESTALTSDGVVPSAEQILTDKGITDSVPYHYRKTGGDGADRLYDQIVGGTVCFNQLFNTSNFSQSTTISGITFTNNGDGTVTANGTATARANFLLGNITVIGGRVYIYGTPDTNNAERWIGNSAYGTQNGMKYMCKMTNNGTVGWNCMVASGTALNNYVFKPQFFDLTQMFGSTIADYIYQLEQTTAGAGVALFKSLFPNDYYPYNSGELVSVSGLSEHKMVGFNQWDEEWELGNRSGQTGETQTGDYISSKNMIPVFPNTQYCIASPNNQGDTTRQFIIYQYDTNGAFINFISVQNNPGVFTTNGKCRYIYFRNNVASTIYNHDICINLSNPTKNGTYEPYKAHSYPLDSDLTLRGLFKLDANSNLYADGDTYDADGTVTRNTILRAYQSGDESLANAITDGTNTVVYSANASTEQATPYQHLQQCDPSGTEEYVSTGIVPIGHNSFYPENLRAKVEQLPWNFASLIAPTESAFVATRNYVTGDLFIVSNVLYKATSNIANGGTITPNTNCTATTLAEIISALA